MRHFPRHPTDIPMAAHVAKESTASNPLLNLSIGGLCCDAENYIAVGTVIDISIPAANPFYQGKGIVTWCREKGDGFEIGICFVEGEDRFRARMVEQVCRIQHYKTNVLEQEGRNLSTEDAAREWIDKYAAAFNQEFPLD